MDTARWTEIKDALGHAERLAGAHRSAFVGTLPERVRAEVAALLDAAEADGLLDAPLATDLAALAGDAPAPDGPDPLLGQPVGPYVVTALLGRGGMGDVYRARRADGLFERDVALKLVRADADRGALLARFAAERRALAALQHPGIARLLGAGTAGDGPAAGRPWLAMEVVDGVPLTDYVQRHATPVAGRVALLADVAEAVHHAHQNLVVHRDIKPSNVLVTAVRGAPQPVLLDFGVAKILDPDADLDLTRQDGARPMTRTYAAPEQLRGEPATTAADVYALGLLVFETLTGRRPFPADAGALAHEHAVLHDDPPRPSHVSGAGGVEARALRGDLDAVCLRALCTEPGGRYPSAAALAADLRRHLAGLPIEARPPTLAYRAGSALRRHRVGAVATLAAVAALVAAGVLHTARLAAERDRAQTAAAQAEALAEVMAQMFDRDPFASDAERLDTLSVGRFVLDRGDAAVARLGQQPAVQMRLLALLGRLHGQLGDPERALVRARRAVHLADSLGDSPDAATARAFTELGTALEASGDFAASVAPYRRALALTRAAYGEGHEATASAMGDLSNALIERPDAASRAEALGLARSALARATRRLGPRHLDVAQAHNNLGAQLITLGRPADAEPHLRQALAIRQAALGDHPLVANTLTNLAHVVLNGGDPAGAVPLFQAATRTYRAALGPSHRAASGSQYGLSEALRDAGRYREAEAAARDALAIDGAALAPDHPFLADERARIGELLVLQGRLAEAEPLLREALSVYGDAAEAATLAGPRADLGRCRLRAGHPGEAAALLRAAVPHLAGAALARARADLREADRR